MLYRVIKRAIERGNYISKEDIKEKISILYVNGQLTEAQYEELLGMLEA